LSVAKIKTSFGNPIRDRPKDKENKMIVEHLTKASHDAGFLEDNLREANRGAKAVDSIILLGLIKDAADLRKKIDVFTGAWKEDNLPIRD
jgi:hypothetical protein